MRLERSLFENIIKNTPLISIDLIVKNVNDEVLLGQRLNRPAQGFWFVPGGRIFKDERLDDAFIRITSEELGIKLTRSSARFIGIYEHFYKNNVFNLDYSTHYVVHGYEIFLDEKNLELPVAQHDVYRWMNVNDLLDDPRVHFNTKNYFISR